MTDTLHYDSSYFVWQRKIGMIGGWANLIKFEKFINHNDNVLEYGCGGGFLLSNIKCGAKIGIDINEAARRQARELGLDVRESVKDIPDGWADIIISNHALEHVHNPLGELLDLRKKLKVGGRIVFVVPSEPITAKYQPNDINQHLFTWAPINLGNLFTTAGYKVDSCEPFMHKWSPKLEIIKKLFGSWAFHLASRIYSYINRSNFQIRVVAHLSK